MELRSLGSTDVQVSPLGLGTTKLGRNQQVKYPHAFAIPEDKAVRELLALTRDLGINLIDTAPAYGNSEERLGKLLPGPRQDWVIVTKVGEIFKQGKSHFDFSEKATRQSIENSLRHLQTDYLDLVLIHSNGEDMRILQEEAVLDTLRSLQQKGLIRAVGMSSKTVEGGLRVVETCDVVMVTYNLEHNDELPVLQAAQDQHKGVLIKKGLMSGHVKGEEGVRQAMSFVFAQPCVSSMVVGTINPAHLSANVVMLQKVLAQPG